MKLVCSKTCGFCGMFFLFFCDGTCSPGQFNSFLRTQTCSMSFFFFLVRFQPVLFSTLLFSSLLFCSVLFCSVLFCSVLMCSVLFCSVLFCSVLFCSVLFCSVLFCSVHCSVLFSVLFCSVLFCFLLFSSLLLFPLILFLFHSLHVGIRNWNKLMLFVADACEDGYIKEKCEELKSFGSCLKRPLQMKNVCPATCGFCRKDFLYILSSFKELFTFLNF